MLLQDDLILTRRDPDLDIPAGEAVEYQLPYTLPDPEPGATYWLNLSFTLAEETPWASRGYEVAYDQFELPRKAEAPALLAEAMPPVALRDLPGEVILHSDEFAVTFDKRTATIRDWTWQGIPLIDAGPQIQLWRAPTDNDRNIKHGGYRAGYDRLAPRAAHGGAELRHAIRLKWTPARRRVFATIL